MEFKVNQGELLKGVKTIDKNGMKMTTDDVARLHIDDSAPDVLIIGQQDYTGTTISVAVPLIGKAAETGTAYIRPHMIRDLVASLSKGDATIHIAASLSCTVKKANGKTQSCATEVLDGPGTWRNAADTRGAFLNAITVPGETLRHMVMGSIYAASALDDKPTLNGIFAEFQGETVTFVGCDGYRMAAVPTHTGKISNAGSECSAIIPLSTAKTVLRQLPKPTKRTQLPEVTLAVYENGVSVQIGTVTIEGKTIPGEYLPYRSFVPEDFKIQSAITVDGIADMLDTVQRAKIVASGEGGELNCGARFTFTETGLQINAESKKMSTSEEIAARALKGTDEEHKLIALNLNYVIDALKNVDAVDGIILNMNTHTTPLLVKPVTDTTGEFHMILPILMNR